MLVSTSVRAGKGSSPAGLEVVLEGTRVSLPKLGRATGSPPNSLPPDTGSVPFRGVALLPTPSLPLLLRSSLCLSSFHPEVPKDPVRISLTDGALAATVPVAAHMPGGGLASMSFMLADRMRLVAEVAEALVEPRGRRNVGEIGEAGEAGEVWLGLVEGGCWEGRFATLD